MKEKMGRIIIWYTNHYRHQARYSKVLQITNMIHFKNTYVNFILNSNIP